MAEQFTLQKRFGEGRAIQRHERSILASTVAMYRPGYQFLARATLAPNEHSGIALRHARDEFHHRCHGCTFSNHRVVQFDVGSQTLILMFERLQMHGVLKRHGEDAGYSRNKAYVVFLKGQIWAHKIERADRIFRPRKFDAEYELLVRRFRTGGFGLVHHIGAFPQSPIHNFPVHLSGLTFPPVAVPTRGPARAVVGGQYDRTALSRYDFEQDI